jgi:hypothetical protein
MMKMTDEQQAICARFNAPYFGCDLHLKIGISSNVRAGLRPLNGMRIRPEADGCGWYIWAGEELSEASDFFVPLHALHLVEWAPLAIPYLGLPPGWRFLITEKYEDVWEDLQLLG